MASIIVRTLGLRLVSFCFRHLRVKCLNSSVINNIILPCLLSVYVLGPFIKGVTGANGIVCRERGLLVLVLCWAEKAGGCRLWEKSTIASNKEQGRAESRQPGVSGDEKKSFLGSRKDVSVSCTSESCWLRWNQTPEARNCLAQTQWAGRDWFTEHFNFNSVSSSLSELIIPVVYFKKKK